MKTTELETTLRCLREIEDRELNLSETMTEQRGGWQDTQKHRMRAANAAIMIDYIETRYESALKLHQEGGAQ